MISWFFEKYLFIQVIAITYFSCLIKDLVKSSKGEFSYGGLILIGIVCIIYIANPKMFHDFLKYMIDAFFDALHSAFGDDPGSDFGTGKKGDADNPLEDGIRLPGQE